MTQAFMRPQPSATEALEAINKACPSDSPAGEIYADTKADLVFDHIAIQALVLRDLLAKLRRTDRHRNLEVVVSDLSMAEALVTQIGALADQMVGGRVVGSLASWCAGPQFDAGPRHTQNKLGTPIDRDVRHA